MRKRIERNSVRHGATKNGHLVLVFSRCYRGSILVEKQQLVLLARRLIVEEDDTLEQRVENAFQVVLRGNRQDFALLCTPPLHIGRTYSGHQTPRSRFDGHRNNNSTRVEELAVSSKARGTAYPRCPIS